MGKKIQDQKKFLMSDAEIFERRERTCFVGNVPLDCSAKYLKHQFSQHGKVEKIWFRSVATQMDSKIPLKGKIIMSEYGDQKDNKNAYVLFEKTEDANKAVTELNQAVIGGKHIRVDIDFVDKEKDPKDYDATLFIGNLPFVTNEEDLRKHFQDVARSDEAEKIEVGKNDGILNVRVIRDKLTHVGKGIGYVQFSSKQLMRLALEQKINEEFKGRQLRMKKAVQPKRLEKKKLRKEKIGEEKQKMKEEREQQSKADDAIIAGGRNFEDAYQSDDSHDEMELKKVLEQENKKDSRSKKIKKDDVNELAENIKKIQEAASQKNQAKSVMQKIRNFKGGKN